VREAEQCFVLRKLMYKATHTVNIEVLVDEKLKLMGKDYIKFIIQNDLLSGLDVIREIIKSNYPEYLAYYDQMMMLK